MRLFFSLFFSFTLLSSFFAVPVIHAQSFFDDQDRNRSSFEQSAGSEAASEGLQAFANRAFGSSGAPRSPVAIAQTIIRGILGFLGLIAVILIMYAGFNWMTAGGVSDKVTKAKSLIINSVIGLIVILSAYAIAEFITNLILRSVG